MIKKKIKATLLHLTISLLIIVAVVGLSLYFWYPKIFIPVTDFKDVLIILLSVDLVLGPFLTFIVFKPKKKSLVFDLSVIALIQIAALVYGTYTLYQVHPVYITFNKDRYTIVQAIDAHPENSKYDEYKVSKLSSGNMAYAKMPNDPKKKEELLMSVLDGGPDLDQRVDYYEPYLENFEKIVSRGLSHEFLIKNLVTNNKLQSFFNNHQSVEGLVFLPLTNGDKAVIIVINKKTAQPVATIDVDPWSLGK